MDAKRTGKPNAEAGESVTFTVPVRPVGKQRPRAGSDGTFYTPTKTAEFEEMVAAHAKRERPRDWSLDGEFRVDVVIRYSGKRRADGDNVQKAVWDGLNGVLYNDDRQVLQWTGVVEVDCGEDNLVVKVRRI